MKRFRIVIGSSRGADGLIGLVGGMGASMGVA